MIRKFLCLEEHAVAAVEADHLSITTQCFKYSSFSLIVCISAPSHIVTTENFFFQLENGVCCLNICLAETTEAIWGIKKTQILCFPCPYPTENISRALC